MLILIVLIRGVVEVRAVILDGIGLHGPVLVHRMGRIHFMMGLREMQEQVR